MDSFNKSELNFTSSPLDADEIYQRTLKKASDVITLMAICSSMLGLGTNIQWKEIWEHLRKPMALCIGIVSQFVVMPLVGFALISLMTLSRAYSLSILLVACCPVGAVANVFTYYLDGDVPLSATMTVLSSLFAMGLMPFNLWFYGLWMETGKLVIPYKDMATSLAYVTFPICLGMIIRWKLPLVAFWITKICNMLGVFLIIITIVLQNLAYPDFLTTVPWTLCVALVALICSGFVLGFCLAWLLKRPMAVRKTISLESGIKNAAIAVAVISISSFTFEEQKSLLTFPIMNLILMIAFWFLFCPVYQIYKKIRRKESDDELQDISFGHTTTKKGSITVSSVAYLRKSYDISPQNYQYARKSICSF